MAILMNDFKAEPAELLAEQSQAAERVLQSGWYILGKEVERFELEWARYCGTRHSIGVGNGMDAIEIGLRALEIKPGDEVITTPITAFATVLAIVRSGAVPVLADIASDSGLLNLDSIKRCISSRTKAVMPVHLYGQIHNMDQIVALCKESGLHLVEDCAQAHGARWGNKMAGSFGEWGAFSFYPTKNLGARGDGGALTTDREDLVAKMRMLRNYGQSDRYHHPILGLNSRLDEMHAAILSVRLKWLEAFTQRRQQIAQMYSKHIRNTHIRLLSQPEKSESHTYHLYVICCSERERLAEHLSKHEIRTLVHYPVPVHRQPPCHNIRLDSNGVPNAVRHANECLSIPCHPQMTNDDVDRVIEVVNVFA